MDQLTKIQRYACNLITGTMFIICGLILLLVGVGAINLNIRDVILPALLYAVGFSLFATAIIQKNTLSMWLSFCFIIPALITNLAVYTKATYSNLYPIYFAIPAIASLFTIPLSDDKLTHIKCVGFFTLIAVILSLKSGAFVGWSVVVPILVIYIGLMILYVSVKSYLDTKKEK